LSPLISLWLDCAHFTILHMISHWSGKLNTSVSAGRGRCQGFSHKQLPNLEVYIILSKWTMEVNKECYLRGELSLPSKSP
jgi:hypothetical protein